MVMLGVSILPLLIGWSQVAGLVTGEVSRVLKMGSGLLHVVIMVGLLIWKRSMVLLSYFLISILGFIFMSCSSPVILIYLLLIFLVPCLYGGEGCMLGTWLYAPSVP
ncbi:MAG: hypothetical protein Q7T86_05500 [Hyphomicrobiaceae bacterium]|nr:hypothetical protein [Hyphomicrobiaceae bacterium]